MKERNKKLGEFGLELEEEEALICKVCLSVYDSSFRVPQLLACGHTFCSICIEKHLNKGGSNKAPCKNKEKCPKNVQVKWQDETKKGSESIKIKCPICDSINLSAATNKMSLVLLTKIQNSLKPGEILVQKDFFETPNGVDWEEGEMEFLGVKQEERKVLKSRNLRLNPIAVNKTFIDNDFKSIRGYVIKPDTLEFEQSENFPQFNSNGIFHHNVTEGIEMQMRTFNIDNNNQITTSNDTIRYPPTLRGIFSPNPAYKTASEEAGVEWKYFTSSNNTGLDDSLPKYSDLTISQESKLYTPMYPDLSPQESSSNATEDSFSVLSSNNSTDKVHEMSMNYNHSQSEGAYQRSSQTSGHGFSAHNYTGVIASHANFGF